MFFHCIHYHSIHSMSDVIAYIYQLLSTPEKDPFQLMFMMENRIQMLDSYEMDQSDPDESVAMALVYLIQEQLHMLQRRVRNVAKADLLLQYIQQHIDLYYSLMDDQEPEEATEYEE